MTPEGDVERLGRKGGHDSFIVLAEWLKENRTSVEARLTRQDKRLEEIRNELVTRLAEIFAEQKRTNGRVTALEKQDELVEALAVNKKEWESERERGEAKQTARVNVLVERRERKRDVLMMAGTGLFASLVGGVGSALGWW